MCIYFDAELMVDVCFFFFFWEIRCMVGMRVYRVKSSQLEFCCCCCSSPVNGLQEPDKQTPIPYARIMK